MEVENNHPNPGNDPNHPLKKKRSPYRLLVDDAVSEDQNDNSTIGLNADKIAELGLFKGDVVSIRVISFTRFFTFRESVESRRWLLLLKWIATLAVSL